MALTGRVLLADEALQLGIVSRVVDDEELDSVATDMAHRIAALPPSAVAMVCRDVRRMANPPVREAMRDEALYLAHIYGTRG